MSSLHLSSSKEVMFNKRRQLLCAPKAMSRVLPGSPAQFGAARAAGIYGFNWGARVRSLVTLLKPQQAQQDGCERRSKGETVGSRFRAACNGVMAAWSGKRCSICAGRIPKSASRPFRHPKCILFSTGSGVLVCFLQSRWTSEE